MPNKPSDQIEKRTREIIQEAIDACHGVKRPNHTDVVAARVQATVEYLDARHAKSVGMVAFAVPQTLTMEHPVSFPNADAGKTERIAIVPASQVAGYLKDGTPVFYGRAP